MSSSPASVAYPATDPGFPVMPVEELLAQHSELLARLKVCYGSDADHFESELMRIVRRYAAYVHLLPATVDNYFDAPGGLFQLGLEVAFFSLQGTDAHIFSGRSTISVRRQMEPRWRLATFIAGLCCECHRALSHVMVTDSDGERWSGYLDPLADWLTAQRAERYFIRWQPHAIETRSLGIFALVHVVPAQMLAHLSEDNSVIVPQLMASIGGAALYRDHNVMDELVRRSLALVIDRNLVANADRYGTPQFGSHLERYFIDAMRRLSATEAAWITNRDKSRVWFGSDGLFLVWPAAAEDILRLLEGDQLRGIPKSPATIFEFLHSAGVLIARDPTHTTWPIQPPGAKTIFEAVRLSSPGILFAGAPPPAPLSTPLASIVDAVPTPAAPPAAATVAPSTQMSLIPDADPPPTAAAPKAPSPPAVAPAAEPVAELSLRAPMRLNPVVRDALDGIVRTLNADQGPAECCTVAEGLFVPLERFEHRGVPPAVALRALAEVRLVVAERNGSTAPPTRTRDFSGAPTVGLVIDPRSIHGIDLQGFLPPQPDGT